ncbi:MAG: hypothetical protein HDR00_15785 [Lachnospiraceae bacterium]|nr:hypothetical protein [Lachnospiraceae bacterium]
MKAHQNDKSIVCNYETTLQALQEAHGTIPYGMTNDYMFRAVLQSNNNVLRGLICIYAALLITLYVVRIMGK